MLTRLQGTGQGKAQQGQGQGGLGWQGQGKAEGCKAKILALRPRPRPNSPATYIPPVPPSCLPYFLTADHSCGSALLFAFSVAFFWKNNCVEFLTTPEVSLSYIALGF